jgi:anti-sigma-K factor RskA
MSDPQNSSNFEEMAALHAVGLLDDASVNKLLDAARTDPEVAKLLRDFEETAAQMAFDAPEKIPPPELRARIFDQLPKRSGTILAFSQWFPYAVAACLMILGISQSAEIFRLSHQLQTVRARNVVVQDEADRLRASYSMASLRLATLEAKDSAYAAAKIMVAWDPFQHQGAIALDSLPAAPAGHDYQLWVLDPNAPAPVSAGVISGGRSFTVQPVSVQNPGFAITLEPAGGSPQPTTPILFAVAPGP